MSQIAQAARTTVCNIWRVSPARLIARFPGSNRTAVGNFAQFMNSFCELPPGPTGGRPDLVQRPQRGQCTGQYIVNASWRAKQIGSSITNQGSGDSVPIPGPLGGAFVFRPTPTFRGAYMRGGDGINYQLTTLYSFSLWENFEWTINSIRRVNNQADNCGVEVLEPATDTQREGEEEGVRENINVTVDADLNVSIPVVFQPRLNPPGIDVRIDGQVNFNFNAGGINFNIGGNNGAGGGGDDLTDALDDIRDSIDQIGSGSEVDLTPIETALTELQESVDETKTKVENVEQSLAVIGQPVNLPTTNESDVCLSEETPIQTVFQAFRVVSEELLKNTQKECRVIATEEEPFFVATSSRQQRVFYQSVPSRTIAVVLNITGSLPDNATYFQTNEATGNFGAISAINFEKRLMETRQVFTRETRIDFENVDATSGVRVFILPNVTFNLVAIRRVE